MRFAVFTHVLHREQNGRYYAYSPYVREMNLWFRHVEKIEVLAPIEGKWGKGEKETGEKGEFYNHPSITFTKIPSFHLLNFPAALNALINIPVIFFRILAAMRRADHLHLRCPGNIGLLACIAQVFFPKKLKTAKFAGNWDPEAKQPWTYKFQKWILGNSFLTRNMKVLVYGQWPNQNKNILPFFTASFSEKNRKVVEKDFSPPYKFIYTGNLVLGKGIFEAIDLVTELNRRGKSCILEIYGDGPFYTDLQHKISAIGLEAIVYLKGRKNLEELKKVYKEAHFVILLSQSEGWPKALAEGMWFGCVPVATAVSCVPWMLGNGSRGILVHGSRRPLFNLQLSKRNVQDEWIDKIAGKVQALLEDREKKKKMSFAAQEWSQQYTLDGFENAIKEVLENER